MTSIRDMPDDMLEKILNYTEETFEEKLARVNSGVELLRLHRLITARENELKANLSKVVVKGGIYRFFFEKNSRILTGRFNRIYLINSVYMGEKVNCINVSEVVPDLEHQRIFGYYRIVEPSMPLNIFNIIEYSKIRLPTETDWDAGIKSGSIYKGLIIGISAPWLVYPQAPALSDYTRYNEPGQANVIYNADMVSNCNRYTFAEIVKVNKNKITLYYPNDPSDPAPNRSVSRITLSKKVCYLLEKQPPHVREMVY